jgi:uncharacterized protein DUF6644
MSLLPFVEWLASTSGSIALHESLYMYPLVESSHVLTLCLFVGMSVIWDLRLLGVVLPNVAMSDMSRRVWPLMLVGFILMSITGVLLFYAIPVRSYQSIWFRVKVIMLVAAGLNAWTFHRSVYRTVETWDTGRPPRRARRAAIASLALWAGIIVAGRMIAYNWFDCDLPQGRFITWAAGCTEKG